MLVSQHDNLALCYQQRKCTHLLQFGRCCSPQFHTLGLADFLQFKISVCFAALAIVLEWHLVPHLNSIDLFQPGYKQNEHLPLTCVCSCWRSDLDTIQLNWAMLNEHSTTVPMQRKRPSIVAPQKPNLAFWKLFRMLSLKLAEGESGN